MQTRCPALIWSGCRGASLVKCVSFIIWVATEQQASFQIAIAPQCRRSSPPVEDAREIVASRQRARARFARSRVARGDPTAGRALALVVLVLAAQARRQGLPSLRDGGQRLRHPEGVDGSRQAALVRVA